MATQKNVQSKLKKIQNDEHSSKNNVEKIDQIMTGVEIIRNITRTLRTFLVLEKEKARVMSLWILLTHLYKQVDVSPVLCLTSPNIPSGKTICLLLMQRLCWQPKLETIQSMKRLNLHPKDVCTLLIDNAYLLETPRTDVVYSLKTAFENRNWTGLSYSAGKSVNHTLFYPKVFAFRGYLEANFQDVCINIPLQPNFKDVVETLNEQKIQELVRLQKSIDEWACQVTLKMNNDEAFAKLDLIDLSARKKYVPLVALCEFAAPELTDALVHSIKYVEDLQSKSISIDIHLMYCLNEVLSDVLDEFIPTNMLISRILDSQRWNTYRASISDLNAKTLSNFFRRISVGECQIESDRRRDRKNTLLRGYFVEQIRKLLSWYSEKGVIAI